MKPYSEPPRDLSQVGSSAVLTVPANDPHFATAPEKVADFGLGLEGFRFRV